MISSANHCAQFLWEGNGKKPIRLGNFTIFSGSLKSSFNRMSRVETRYFVRHGKMFITYRKFKDRQELMLPPSRRVVFKGN